MHILFLSNDIGRGGAERQIVALAKAMRSRGHEVTVGVLMCFLEFEDELLAHGIHTFSLHIKDKRNATLAYPKLVQMLRRTRPDVVHAHLFWSVVAARLARALTQVPVLVSTSHTPFERNPWRYRILAATDRFCDQWTTVTREGLDTHLAAKATRSGVLMRNGIAAMKAERDRNSVRRELGVTSDEFLWVSLGSLRDDQKDYPNLIAALAKGAMGTVVVAGKGPEQSKLEALAAQAGISARIRFLGLRTDVADLLAAADGFVQSSWFEALPIALLEASMMQLPIVATDVGDTRSVVLHGETGLLVAKQNPQVLADAMSKLVVMPEADRRAWGQRAAAHTALNFGLDAVVERWVELYRELLERRRKGREKFRSQRSERCYGAPMKRYLVTGVAGFIGSNLLEHLLASGHSVVGLDNFATGHRRNLDEVRASLTTEAWGKFTFLEGDIRDASACEAATRDVDIILHQAALGSVPRSLADPLTTNATNITGFLNMLVAAQNNGVRRFVYAASSSTYGDHPGLPKIEDRIGKPLSPYAVTKYVNELYADVWTRQFGLETVGLRYFNVFGPRQDPNGAYAAVIPKWVWSLLAHEQVFINGDGETSRDFCFVKNVVQANMLAATTDNPNALGQVYNVALGDRTTLSELFYELRDGLAKHDPTIKDVTPHFRDFRAGDVRHSQAAIDKARELLGYQPTHRVRDGIREALDWYIAAYQDGRLTR